MRGLRFDPTAGPAGDINRGDLSLTHPWFLGRYWIAQRLRQFCPATGGVMLDLGCGMKPYHAVFAARARAYWGVDYPSGGTDLSAQPDVWGDAHDLPFRSQVADTVIITQLLELMARPERVLREGHRILKRDGVLVLTALQTWPSMGRNDYTRFTHARLTWTLAEVGFQVESILPLGGFWSNLGQMVNNYLRYAYGPLPPGARSLGGLIHGMVRGLKPLLIPGINLLALRLDRWQPAGGDTVGWAVLARKR